jgi:hypothetical protein
MRIRYLLGGACALLLLLPLRAVAENIGNVTPDTWDYGEVELGASESMSFTFESVGPETALSLSGIYMLDDSGAFEITSVTRVESGIELEVPYDTTLVLGEHVEIVVEFAPTYAGMFAGQILIMSNAYNFPSYYIPIQGEGVPYEPTPGELMEDLIDQFDDCVAEGALWGEGSGNAGTAHLRVFDGMLDAADDLIGLGDIDGACRQLDHASVKSDGVSPPPDFIGGACTGTINTMIGVVMETLGCD